MDKENIINLQKQLIIEQTKILEKYKEKSSLIFDELKIEQLKEKIKKHLINDKEINYLNVHSYIKLMISYKLKDHYTSPFYYK